MTKSDSHSKQSSSFYPINIEVAGKRAFVFGGQKDALFEVTRLLDFGANVDVVAPHLMAELQELQITYGDRVKVARRQFDDTDRAKFRQKAYFLVFAMDHDDAGNWKVIQAAQNANLLAFGVNQAKGSSFITPSVLKRGHLKISVSADAVSQASERAILQRIEASFVTHIDKYVLFLDRLSEKLANLSNDPHFQIENNLIQVTKELYNCEDIFLALQRQSFEEADSLVERIILTHKLPQAEPA
jgi:precorrin-2 dehydrogenase/sirohydrochlorin ferrochelatase